jgi:hypothetical protein
MDRKYRFEGDSMAYKKLSPEEISETIAKIRTKYEFYCKHFFKPPKIKDEFERRYRSMLQAGVDVSNFLLAEIEAITELIRKEEDKLSNAAPPKDKPKMDFADKVIIENLKKIEKYPEVRIHKDSNEEVRKLLGTLNYIYEELLPSLHSVFRDSSVNPNVREVGNIEAELRTFAYMGKGNLPQRLSRYFTLLSRFPRDYRAMTFEEKEYIRESAFLLHDLVQALDSFFETTPDLEENSKKQLVDIVTYVKNVIIDFRLKDLKRKEGSK